MPKFALSFHEIYVHQFFPPQFQVLSTEIQNDEVLSVIEKKNVLPVQIFSKGASTYAVTFSSTGAS